MKKGNEKNKSKNGQWPLWAFVTWCGFVGSADLHTIILCSELKFYVYFVKGALRSY